MVFVLFFVYQYIGLDCAKDIFCFHNLYLRDNNKNKNSKNKIIVSKI